MYSSSFSSQSASIGPFTNPRGQLSTAGHTLASYFSVNTSKSLRVKSLLFLLPEHLAISLLMRKSLMQNSGPFLVSLEGDTPRGEAEYAQTLHKMRPCLSYQPVYTLTSLPSIISLSNFLTQPPNYFVSHFLISGVQRPLSRNKALMGLPSKVMAILRVQPSITSSTLPIMDLNLRDNSSASYILSRLSYCQIVSLASCCRATPRGNRVLMLCSIMSFLVSFKLRGVLRYLLKAGLSLAEPSSSALQSESELPILLAGLPSRLFIFTRFYINISDSNVCLGTWALEHARRQDQTHE